MGSGDTASAFSSIWPAGRCSFMAFVLPRDAFFQGVSRAKNDLIAFHSHLIGSDALVRVETVPAVVETERPVVPGTAHDGAILAKLAVAQRGTLVDAAVGQREEPIVAAEHRNGAGAGAERAALA